MASSDGKPQRRWPWALLVLSTAACALALMAGMRAGSPSGSIARPSPSSVELVPRAPSSPELKTELAMLQAQIAGLRDQVLETEQARQRAERTATAEREPSPPPLEGPEIRTRYEQVFDSQLADTNWARTEQQALSTFFRSDAAAGARVEALECRSTMCRARLRFEARAARDRFLTNIGAPPFDKGSFWSSDSGGQNLTLFTAREGQALPDVSQ